MMGGSIKTHTHIHAEPGRKHNAFHHYVGGGIKIGVRNWYAGPEKN